MHWLTSRPFSLSDVAWPLVRSVTFSLIGLRDLGCITTNPGILASRPDSRCAHARARFSCVRAFIWGNVTRTHPNQTRSNHDSPRKEALRCNGRTHSRHDRTRATLEEATEADSGSAARNVVLKTLPSRCVRTTGGRASGVQGYSDFKTS